MNSMQKYLRIFIRLIRIPLELATDRMVNRNNRIFNLTEIGRFQLKYTIFTSLSRS